jgi:hypothetical protein
VAGGFCISTATSLFVTFYIRSELRVAFVRTLNRHMRQSLQLRLLHGNGYAPVHFYVSMECVFCSISIYFQAYGTAANSMLTGVRGWLRVYFIHMSIKTFEYNKYTEVHVQHLRFAHRVG